MNFFSKSIIVILLISLIGIFYKFLVLSLFYKTIIIIVAFSITFSYLILRVFFKAYFVHVANFNKKNSVKVLEIYKQNYENSGFTELEFKDLWYDIAIAFFMPAEKINLNDKFGIDIGLKLWIEHEGFDILREVGSYRANKIGKDFDLTVIETVNDYIMFFSKNKY